MSSTFVEAFFQIGIGALDAEFGSNQWPNPLIKQNAQMDLVIVAATAVPTTQTTIYTNIQHT